MRAKLNRLVQANLRIPLPGGGETQRRFQLLAEWAGRDLSLGRLAEGHVDALAIRSEAGLPATSGSAGPESAGPESPGPESAGPESPGSESPGPESPGSESPGPESAGSESAGSESAGSGVTTYGVWAARSRSNGTVLTRHQSGWRLSGAKEFCSGADLLDRALVTADATDGYRLVDVDLSSSRISVKDGSWMAVGMADSESVTVCFDEVAVAAGDLVGAPGFYVGRPGFWFGGVGVAACWFGGARALLAQLLIGLSPTVSEHVLADVGRAISEMHSMDAVLERAAREIDADPSDARGSARRLALTTREAVHRGCIAVLELTASAGGARPLGHNAQQARRAADLYVYLSQHHGGADPAQIGRLALDARPCN